MFTSLHSKDQQSALIAQLSHAWAGPAHHQLCQCLCNHGDCVAVTSQAYQVSLENLDMLYNQTRHLTLHNLGLQPGDVVIVH